MHALTDVKNYVENEDEGEMLVQGGYSAERIVDLLQGEDSDKILLEDSMMGGGSPMFPESLRELLKDLYVPIGLFTHIKPCSARSYAHNGMCVSDGMFDELDKLTSIAYKTGGTRKSVDVAKKQTKRNKDILKILK